MIVEGQLKCEKILSTEEILFMKHIIRNFYLNTITLFLNKYHNYPSFLLITVENRKYFNIIIHK